MLLSNLTDAGLLLALFACVERGPLDMLAALCYLLGPLSTLASDRLPSNTILSKFMSRSILVCRMSSDVIVSPLCVQSVVPRAAGEWMTFHAIVCAALSMRHKTPATAEQLATPLGRKTSNVVNETLAAAVSNSIHEVNAAVLGEAAAAAAPAPAPAPAPASPAHEGGDGSSSSPATTTADEEEGSAANAGEADFYEQAMAEAAQIVTVADEEKGSKGGAATSSSEGEEHSSSSNSGGGGGGNKRWEKRPTGSHTVLTRVDVIALRSGLDKLILGTGINNKIQTWRLALFCPRALVTAALLAVPPSDFATFGKLFATLTSNNNNNSSDQKNARPHAVATTTKSKTALSNSDSKKWAFPSHEHDLLLRVFMGDFLNFYQKQGDLSRVTRIELAPTFFEQLTGLDPLFAAPREQVVGDAEDNVLYAFIHSTRGASGKDRGKKLGEFLRTDLRDMAQSNPDRALRVAVEEADQMQRAITLSGSNFFSLKRPEDLDDLRRRLRSAATLLNLTWVRDKHAHSLNALAVRCIDVWCSLLEMQVPDAHGIFLPHVVCTLLRRCEQSKTMKDPAANQMSLTLDPARTAQNFYAFVRNLASKPWVEAFNNEFASGGGSSDRFSGGGDGSAAVGGGAWADYISMSNIFGRSINFVSDVEFLLRPSRTGGGQRFISIQSAGIVLEIASKSSEAMREATAQVMANDVPPDEIRLALARCAMSMCRLANTVCRLLYHQSTREKIRNNAVQIVHMAIEFSKISVRQIADTNPVEALVVVNDNITAVLAFTRILRVRDVSGVHSHHHQAYTASSSSAASSDNNSTQHNNNKSVMMVGNAPSIGHVNNWRSYVPGLRQDHLIMMKLVERVFGMPPQLEDFSSDNLRPLPVEDIEASDLLVSKNPATEAAGGTASGGTNGISGASHHQNSPTASDADFAFGNMLVDVETNTAIDASLLLRAWRGLHSEAAQHNISRISFKLISFATRNISRNMRIVRHRGPVVTSGKVAMAAFMLLGLRLQRNVTEISDAAVVVSMFISAVYLRSRANPELHSFIAAQMLKSETWITPVNPSIREIERLSQRSNYSDNVMSLFGVLITTVTYFRSLDELLSVDKRINEINNAILMPQESKNATTTTTNNNNNNNNNNKIPKLDLVLPTLLKFANDIYFPVVNAVMREVAPDTRGLHLTRFISRTIRDDEISLIVTSFKVCSLMIALRSALTEGNNSTATHHDDGDNDIHQQRESGKKSSDNDDVDEQHPATTTTAANEAFGALRPAVRHLDMLCEVVRSNVERFEEDDTAVDKLVSYIDIMPRSHCPRTPVRLRDFLTSRASKRHNLEQDELARLTRSQGTAADSTSSAATSDDAEQQRQKASGGQQQASSAQPLQPKTLDEVVRRTKELISYGITAYNATAWNRVFSPAVLESVVSLSKCLEADERQKFTAEQLEQFVEEARPIFDCFQQCPTEYLARCSTELSAPTHGLTKTLLAGFSTSLEIILIEELAQRENHRKIVDQQTNNNGGGGEATMEAALVASFKRRLRHANVVRRLLPTLIVLRMMYTGRLTALVDKCMEELDATRALERSLLLKKRKQTQQTAQEGAAAAAAAELPLLFTTVSQYKEVIIELVQTSLAFWRNGTAAVIAHPHSQTTHDLDFSLMVRLTEGVMPDGCQPATFTYRPPYALRQAHSIPQAEARRLPVVESLSFFPTSKLLLMLDRCMLNLRAACRGGDAASSLSSSSSSDATTKNAMNAAAAQSSVGAHPADSLVTNKDVFHHALSVVEACLIHQNTGGYFVPVVSELAKLLLSGNRRFVVSAAATAATTTSSTGSGDTAGNNNKNSANQHHATTSTMTESSYNDDPHTAVVFDAEKEKLFGPFGIVEFPNRTVDGGEIITVTAVDILRTIALCYVADQRTLIEELCAKFAPVLHTRGVANDWEITSYNVLVSNSSPAWIKEIEEHYQAMLEQAEANSIRFDGRVDVSATQQLDGLARLVRETRSYTLSNVLRHDPRLSANIVVTLLAVIEQLERVDRSFHMFAKTVLMTSVDPSCSDMSSIVKYLGLCEFKFRRGTASLTNVSQVHQSRKRLSELLTARATTVVQGL